MDDQPNQGQPRRVTRQPSGPPIRLGALLEQVAAERGIARSRLVESFEAAILAAAQRAFGPARDLLAQLNEETGEIDLYQNLTVVEAVSEPEREISVEAVAKHGGLGDTEPGEQFGFQIFWRPEDAAMAREQDRAFGSVMPPIRDADRAIIHDEYEARRAELSPPPETPTRKRQRAAAGKPTT